MSALILSGQPLVEKMCCELQPRIEQFRKAHGVAPTLAALRVGNAPAAVSYAHSIDRAFTQCGMGFQMEALPDATTAEQIIARLAELDRDDHVHGILLQRPLPPILDWRAIMIAFPFIKDVEGASPINFGKLALDVGEYFATTTPDAALEILRHYEISPAGKHAVIVGRSNILGKPLALLLLRANATVTVCHTHTRDLAQYTRQADLLIAAAGSPKFITGDMIAPAAIVIDFGVNLRGEHLVGDVDFAAAQTIASAITPVPGGTGPVTSMLLMRNTIHAAEQQIKHMGTRGRIRWLPTLRTKPRK